MDVWRCKVLLRYGIRNNVGLYRCRLCGGDVSFCVWAISFGPPLTAIIVGVEKLVANIIRTRPRHKS